MNMRRVWAMPSPDTFSCQPIGHLVKRYLAKSQVSVDPFARNKRWATYTNDLNPDTAAEYHNDILSVGGVVISCGWNSIGMGKFKYQIEDLLLVCHGAAHNDTIVMVERKKSHQPSLLSSNSMCNITSASTLTHATHEKASGAEQSV